MTEDRIETTRAIPADVQTTHWPDSPGGALGCYASHRLCAIERVSELSAALIDQAEELHALQAPGTPYDHGYQRGSDVAGKALAEAQQRITDLERTQAVADESVREYKRIAWEQGEQTLAARNALAERDATIERLTEERDAADVRVVDRTLESVVVRASGKRIVELEAERAADAATIARLTQERNRYLADALLLNEQRDRAIESAEQAYKREDVADSKLAASEQRAAALVEAGNALVYVYDSDSYEWFPELAAAVDALRAALAASADADDREGE